MEEGLVLVQGNPDTYSMRALYLISNLMSLCGFTLMLSLPFMFAEPRLECTSEDVKIDFRCSAALACSKYPDNYHIIGSKYVSMVAQYAAVCS